jgi:hypothetical protein
VDGALTAVTTGFAKINGNSDNFNFLHYLKKHKNMKEEDLRAQCVKPHTAFCDGDSYNISSVELLYRLRFRISGK